LGRPAGVWLQSNNTACLAAALVDLTYVPQPDFSGVDTITLVAVALSAEDASLPLPLLWPAAHDLLATTFGAVIATETVAVAPLLDVPELFNPGYLFLRELEQTPLWGMDVAHGDGDATQLSVLVDVSLGAVGLADHVLAALVINGGAPVAWPVSSFTMEGNRTAVSAGLSGLVYHATSCEYVEGACESRFSLLDLTVSDAAGATDRHSVLVDVTCIAEVPHLVVPEATGDEDDAVPLPMECWPLDPLELVTIFISDIPAGVTFNQGKQQGARWRLELSELPGLTVRSVPDSHADFNLTITARAIEVTNGATAANETQVLVRLAPVNDPPVMQAPGTQFALEETRSRLGRAVISDPQDLPSGIGGRYRVTVSAAHGILTYGLQFGNETGPPSCAAELSLLACAGWGTHTLTLTGAMEHVNAVLDRTLFYRGDLDYDQTDEVQWSVDDLNTGGTGGPGPGLVASDTAPVIVRPVNDAPRITLDSIPAGGGCEPDLGNLTCLPEVAYFHPREDCAEETLLGHGVMVLDVDDKGDNYTVRLGSRYGAWSVNAAYRTSVTFERGTGIDDDAMMFYGRRSDVNNVLSSLRYIGSADFHGDDYLSIWVMDKPVDGTGALFDLAVYRFAVRPVNDPPRLSVRMSRTLVTPGSFTRLSIGVTDDQVGPTSYHLLHHLTPAFSRCTASISHCIPCPRVSLEPTPVTSSRSVVFGCFTPHA